MKINKEIELHPVLKTFFRFLKNKKVLNQWKKNINLINFQCALRNKQYHELINYSFIWKDTKEGDDFWYFIHMGWKAYYSQSISKKLIYG